MFRARARVSSVVLALIALALGSGCDKDKEKERVVTTTAAGSAASAVGTAGAAGTATPMTIATANLTKREPSVTFAGLGFMAPESVMHDDAADIYLVSNINGKPDAADNNGFIARLTPDGKVETLKWIEGGKNKVTLNAPKGLGLMGDFLYVTDIDTVRIFDRKTGAPEGEVKIPGATFLNDLAVTTDGHILVADTGVKVGANGFEPTGTDGVWSIDKAKKATPLIKNKELGGPNGLLPTKDKTWVVTLGSGEMYSVDEKGKKGDAKKLPKGSLDGIVILPGGDVLVSSWEANAIFRGPPGGEFASVIENVKSPADIGYDNKRNRVLVPLLKSNEVRAYDIPASTLSRPQ